jgi:hypothetical protein
MSTHYEDVPWKQDIEFPYQEEVEDLDCAAPGAYYFWRKMRALRIVSTKNQCNRSVRELTGRDFPFDNNGSSEMYHFRFPEAFVGRIGNVELAGVTPHLEALFPGLELERPDCEYLIDSLRQYAHKLHPLNIERAINWLEDRKQTLPIWPPEYEEPREDHPIVRKLKASAPGVATVITQVVGKVAFSEPIETIWVDKSTVQPKTDAVSSDKDPCIYPFSLDEADSIAEKAGLIEKGLFVLDTKKLSAIVGFHQALKHAKLVTGTIRQLNAFFGARYGVSVNTEKYSTKVGCQFYKTVSARLKK